MIKYANKILRKIFFFISLLLLTYITYNYFIGSWTVDDLSQFGIDLMVYGVPLALLFYFIYKMYIEKILLWWARKRSAEIITDDIPKGCQVDGVRRSGKDASTTGEAILVRETLMKRYKKELKETPYKAFIYDFKSINDYLNKNGKKYFVASEKKFNEVFVQMLKDNECFIDPYFMKKLKLTPRNHINTWKYRKNKFIADVPFEDGVTVGGRHMLDLLRRYVALYVRYHFLPNYIMSNQPILETFTIVKKERIKRLFSKKFSQDYIKLKEENTPTPYIMGTFITETETAIFYSNTDGEIESEVKSETGIREFHTIFGHIMREEAYMRGITQSKVRVTKSLRELYEGYIHIFGLEFRGTSNYIRTIYAIRRFLKKFKILRIKLYRIIVPQQVLKGTLSNKIKKTTQKISLLHQKDCKKWAKGYIVFYKGIYDKIEDSGKVVKFPILWGLRKANKGTLYNSYGFKQFNKITDSFGRYDTHFMYTVREAKDQIMDMHFNDVPNWTSFKMENEDILEMNYRVFKDMIKASISKKEREEKEAKQRRLKELQRQQNVELPNLKNLELKELLGLALDFGLTTKDKLKQVEKIDMKVLIKQLNVEYKSFNGKEKKK